MSGRGALTTVGFGSGQFVVKREGKLAGRGSFRLKVEWGHWLYTLADFFALGLPDMRSAFYSRKFPAYVLALLKLERVRFLGLADPQLGRFVGMVGPQK